MPPLAVTILLMRWLGIAGWRGGAVGVTVVLVIVAVAIGFVASGGRRAAGWPAYTIGCMVIALLGAAWCAQDPPMSHARLAQELKRLPASFSKGKRTDSGHGWCRPDCPTITLRFAPQPVTLAGELGRAAIALDAAELIPHDKQRTFSARVYSITGRGRNVRIDHRRFTTTLSGVERDGQTTITIAIESHRGYHTQPEKPIAL